ncbi:MAG: ATP-binding cassette domain-containing protein, partial [Chlorobiota bacterium]
MIKIAGLAKNYKKLRALDSVSVELREGAVTAIVGPNGSGKTTLLKSILGLVIPDSGAIDLNGTSIFNNNEFKRLTGYLPQY